MPNSFHKIGSIRDGTLFIPYKHIQDLVRGQCGIIFQQCTVEINKWENYKSSHIKLLFSCNHWPRPCSYIIHHWPSLTWVVILWSSSNCRSKLSSSSLPTFLSAFCFDKIQVCVSTYKTLLLYIGSFEDGVGDLNLRLTLGNLIEMLCPQVGNLGWSSMLLSLMTQS